MRPVTSLAAAALILSATSAAAARSAADPCAVSWSDPPGDTTYGLGVAVPVTDDDLDVTRVRVEATRDDLVATVTVRHLSPAGPAYGTGHGVGLFLTDHGTALRFVARLDQTYGDKTAATGDTATRQTPVHLAVDPRANAFTLTVARADLERLAGSPTGGGRLTGLGALTVRSDHLAGTSETAGLAARGSVGTSADTAAGSGDGATLDLDACDAHLRRLPPARPQRVSSTVSDGFTVSGLAGSQAVIRLTRETGPPGQLQHGPPVTLAASKGVLAGLAIVGVRNGWYDTVVRTLSKETYDTDADTNVPYDRRLPKGDYLVVLLGAPGATVTATVQPSSSRVRPVKVLPTGRGTPELHPTANLGAGQRAQGEWGRQQVHRKVLLGVVHVATIQYGNAVSYSLAVPGHNKVGTAALSSDAPGPAPLSLAWTPVSATHVAFGVSTAVETTVTAAWSGEAQGASAEQHGYALYVPLVL